MNIDDLTIGQAKQLTALFGHSAEATRPINHGLIGKYVIVRCHDAGVHAGVLADTNGRECVLKNSRRLWYWKPADGQAFLSGVAVAGLDPTSKVGAPVPTILLTEDCEIIETTAEAADSIKKAKSYEP